MPEIILNLEALAHNAGEARRLTGGWNISVLPVLKGICSHPAAVAELMRRGFDRFGFGEPGEPLAFGSGPALQRDGRVLIQLTPLSRVHQVVERFQRSFQSMPETIKALSGAADGLALEHEALLMVDLGDNREGLPPEDLGELLDLALKQRRIRPVGFGVSLACLGNKLPGRSDLEKLAQLAALFRDRGVKQPVVSVGGSVFCNFMDQAPAGLITELRMGDPFLIGHDIYRDQPLPRGSFRNDVCSLSAEVVEVKTLRINGGADSPPRHIGNTDLRPRAGLNGIRTRALCEMGRFHTGLSAALVSLERLSCEKPGCILVGLTAGYVVVDVTDCPDPVKVGQRLNFHPGYWAMAHAFRNPLVRIEVQDGTRAPESCAA